MNEYYKYMFNIIIYIINIHELYLYNTIHYNLSTTLTYMKLLTMICPYDTWSRYIFSTF